LTTRERQLLHLDPSLTDDEIAAWFTVDDTEPTYSDKSDEEIVAMVSPVMMRMNSSHEVIACTDKLLQWPEQLKMMRIFK
jgi:hypothetical protein